jgi:hypothetical protein
MDVTSAQKPNFFFDLDWSFRDHIWLDQLTFRATFAVKRVYCVMFIVPDIDLLLKHHVTPAPK